MFPTNQETTLSDALRRGEGGSYVHSNTNNFLADHRRQDPQVRIRGRDSIDDVKAWIEKRYDAVTVNGQSISLDELEQIGLKHVAEGIGADLDDDGVGDRAVGAVLDDDGGLQRGAVWVLFLDGICVWDLDANGSVGVSDVLALLANWGPCP